jgi:probable HAF family extracellular repeat protein
MTGFVRQAAVLFTIMMMGVYTPVASGAGYSISIFNMTLGGDSADSYRINSQGAIVGQSLTAHETLVEFEPGVFVPAQDIHAFVYSNGVMTDLGTLGGVNSYGRGINDQGVAIGYSDATAGNPRAFKYEGGVMYDLGTLGGNNSGAVAINNNGQIVGGATDSNNTYSHAFLYENGAMNDLGTLGGNLSVANDVNNSGVVVGSSWQLNSTLDRAFVYQNGVMNDLGVLPGASSSKAIAINDLGQIIGESGWGAFFYVNGVMTELVGLGGGGPVWVSDINNNGLVVGSSKSPLDGYYDAVLWKDGVLTNLNSFVSEDWSLTSAASINDSGQIIGTGIYQGNTVTYVLTPVPIPASIWLFASGMMVLLSRAKLRN